MAACNGGIGHHSTAPAPPSRDAIDVMFLQSIKFETISISFIVLYGPHTTPTHRKYTKSKWKWAKLGCSGAAKFIWIWKTASDKLAHTISPSSQFLSRVLQIPWRTVILFDAFSFLISFSGKCAVALPNDLSSCLVLARSRASSVNIAFGQCEAALTKCSLLRSVELLWFDVAYGKCCLLQIQWESHVRISKIPSIIVHFQAPIEKCLFSWKLNLMRLHEPKINATPNQCSVLNEYERTDSAAGSWWEGLSFN